MKPEEIAEICAREVLSEPHADDIAFFRLAFCFGYEHARMFVPIAVGAGVIIGFLLGISI